MNDLKELELRRSEIQDQIDGYRGTPCYTTNEIFQLQLETALLKRDIINIQITLLNTTNEEERRDLNEERKRLQTTLDKMLSLLFQEKEKQRTGSAILRREVNEVKDDNIHISGRDGLALGKNILSLKRQLSSFPSHLTKLFYRCS
jgi:hypothetical protein